MGSKKNKGGTKEARSSEMERASQADKEAMLRLLLDNLTIDSPEHLVCMLATSRSHEDNRFTLPSPDAVAADAAMLGPQRSMFALSSLVCRSRGFVDVLVSSIPCHKRLAQSICKNASILHRHIMKAEMDTIAARDEKTGGSEDVALACWRVFARDAAMCVAGLCESLSDAPALLRRIAYAFGDAYASEGLVALLMVIERRCNADRDVRDIIKHATNAMLLLFELHPRQAHYSTMLMQMTKFTFLELLHAQHEHADAAGHDAAFRPTVHTMLEAKASVMCTHALVVAEQLGQELEAVLSDAATDPEEKEGLAAYSWKQLMDMGSVLGSVSLAIETQGGAAPLHLRRAHTSAQLALAFGTIVRKMRDLGSAHTYLRRALTPLFMTLVAKVATSVIGPDRTPPAAADVVAACCDVLTILGDWIDVASDGASDLQSARNLVKATIAARTASALSAAVAATPPPSTRAQAEAEAEAEAEADAEAKAGARMRAELAELAQTNRKLERELDAARARMQKVRDDAADVQARAFRALEDKAVVDEKLRAAKQERLATREALQREKDALEDEKNGAEAALRALRAEVSALRLELDEAAHSRQRMVAALQGTVDECEALHEEVHDAKQRSASVAAELHSATEKLARSRGELLAVNKAAEDAVADARARRIASAKRCEHAVGNMARMGDDMAAMMAHVINMKECHDRNMCHMYRVVHQLQQSFRGDSGDGDFHGAPETY